VSLGLGLGVATALADAAVGFGPDERQWVRAVVVMLNLATTWAAAAFVAGRLIGSLPSGAIGGLVTLWLAVLGYYLFGLTLGDRTQVGWQGLLGPVRMWLLVGVAAGPIFGALGSASTRPNRTALGMAPLPLLALVEVFGRIGWTVQDLDNDPVLGWTLLSIAIAAAALLFVLAARVALARRPASSVHEREGKAAG
jgi:hypothetical protein